MAEARSARLRRAYPSSGVGRGARVAAWAVGLAVAAWCQAADARPIVQVTPISGGLGLFDLAVQAAGPGVKGLVAEVDRDGGRTLAVELDADPEAPGWWRTRVFAGERPDRAAPIRVRLWRLDDAGERTGGEEIDVVAEPPAGRGTPDWAKGAVWYQVFVERFRNGNPANDPAAPEFYPAAWDEPWGEVSIDELELARARAAGQDAPAALNPHRRGGQFLNVHPWRRYGGDLEGVLDRAGHMRTLGVTAVYLNPIFEAHSHHKYDASDHRHIDPAFAGPGRSAEEAARLARETADPATWTLTAADRFFIEQLAPGLRAHELRIVLDGVWNHVGTRHWAFADVMARGAASPYRDWFKVVFADDDRFPAWATETLDLRPGRLIGWKSWGGGGRNGGLPELARDAETGRLFPAAERHIFDVAARWGPHIDGWRLDVVPDMSREFWRAWAGQARASGADVGLFAEVWFDARAYFAAPDDEGEARIFDGQMNYPFAMPAVRWLAGETSMSAERLATTLGRVFSQAPQHDLVQMNLYGSHDTERLASMLANPGRDYDQQGHPETNPDYDAGRPSAEVYRRVVLGVALQTVEVGAPMVYAGDELGMYGGDDPHCRQPLPWPDLGPRRNRAEEAEPGLAERFGAWLRLRADPEIGPVLRFGSARRPASGDPDVYVIERALNGRRLIAVLNRAANRSVDASRWVLPRFTPAGPGSDPADRMVGPLSARLWVER